MDTYCGRELVQDTRNGMGELLESLMMKMKGTMSWVDNAAGYNIKDSYNRTGLIWYKGDL